MVTRRFHLLPTRDDRSAEVRLVNLLIPRETDITVDAVDGAARDLVLDRRVEGGDGKNQVLDVVNEGGAERVVGIAMRIEPGLIVVRLESGEELG